MNHELPSQIDKSLGLGIEPERVVMPLNGYSDDDHIFLEDGRKLYLIGRREEVDEGGDDLGEFLAIDVVRNKVEIPRCINLDAKVAAAKRYREAGWRIIETGMSLKVFAYMDREEYDRKMMHIVEEQLKNREQI